MAPHRRNIGASRRRRKEEEGEDEGSVDGGLDDDSLSEGSDASHQEDEDADGESSDGSDTEATTSTPQVDRVNGGHRVNGRVPNTRNALSPGKPGKDSTVSDTEAMMNGLKISDSTSETGAIHFDNMKEEQLDDQVGRTPSSVPPTESRRETFGEKKRREHERYLKERDKNPAFVPTRGSFFLHDKRSTEPGTSGHKAFNKSKSRPYGLIVDGNVQRYGSYASPVKKKGRKEGPPLTCTETTDQMPVKGRGLTISTIPLLETNQRLPPNPLLLQRQQHQML